MKGTEKQIKWAEQIKRAAIAKNEHEMSEAQKRYDHEKEAGKGIYDLRKMTYNVMYKGYENLDDAAFIIDNRKNLCQIVVRLNASEFDKTMLMEFFEKPSDFFHWI